MKKYCFLLLVVLLVTSIVAGCSSSTPTSTPSTSISPSQSTGARTSATPTSSTATTPATPPAKVYKWRLQAFMPPSDDLYSKYIAVNLVNKIKEATNGQIEVTPYSGGALVPPTEIFKSVASGIVELGYTATSYQIGFIPVTAVVDGLPMSFRNYQDLLTLYRQKGLGEILSTEYDKNGVHLLTLHATEAYTVLSSKALKTKADWQGAKIRGWGIWNQYFGKLGASAVDMPLKDVYMALSLKTIDGVLTGINPHYQLKHYEVCKYGVWPPLQGSSSHDLYINNDVWKSLPDNLKQSLTQACSQWTDDTAEKWYQFSLENKNNLSSKGVQWIEPDDRAWMTENATSLWAETAAKDAPSAKAVKIMTDYLKEQGVIK